MAPRTSHSTNPRDDLRSRRIELIRRLNDGDEQISIARRNGADTTRWENHWITLLREYESISRELDGAASDQIPAAA